MRKTAVKAIALFHVFCIILFLAMPEISLAGNTWYVDDNGSVPGSGTIADPFPTIRQGITAAVPGDRVQVAAGTYTEKISMKSSVMILGEGADRTIIDGGGNGSVVSAVNVDDTALLSGFTITNGTGTLDSGKTCGGGIYLNNSDPLICNNRIQNNHAEYGAGIYSYNGDPVISNNTIADNGLSNWQAIQGGGIYCNYGSTEIVNNLIVDNRASDGGGICLNGGHSNITNCSISGNDSASGAGGIHVLLPAYKTVTNCIVWNNNWPEISGSPYVQYSSILGGWTGGGSGNIFANPNWSSGPGGDYYLGTGSGCVNSGSTEAASLCYAVTGGTRCMAHLTTRTDEVHDTGQVDMGYHYDRHLFVPDDCATIQCAIDMAIPGDTIMVRPGTYVETIDFKGKSIIVKSTDGPAVTTIDGNHTGTVVTFDSGEDNNTVLEGFTIKNGNGFTGGGIYCTNSSPQILNNIIQQNHASIVGGGVSLGGAGVTPRLTGNRIESNTADVYGGGIDCSITNPLTIERNTITGNMAIRGGGIMCQGATLKMINMTIAKNTATADLGGGIYAYGASTLTIENTIISFNTRGDAVKCNDAGSTATLFCSDIYGNTGGDYVGSIAGQNLVNNNLSVDPLFCNFASDDYTLHENSPCAEENQLNRGLVGSKPVGCAPATFFVAVDGTGDYATIQDAIDAAPPGSIVQLEEGTYTGEGNRNLDFHGKAITLRGLPDFPEDCKIDAQGSAASPQRGFYFHSGEDADSVVEGLIVINGYADNGGGILCDNSSPTLTKVYLDNNHATVDGGGLACLNHASPTLDDGFLYQCSAGDDGGGLYATNYSSPILNNCLFQSNQAVNRGGGALFVVNSFPELSGCTFQENTAANGGGVNFVYARGPMTDCLFYGNSATYGGGLQCYGNAHCTLTRCTFYGNTATAGGGLYLRNNASPTLDRTIIASSTQGGAIDRMEETNIPMLTCSDIWGNTGGDWVSFIAGQMGVDGNISQDPLFCNAAGRNFTLDANSPCAPVNTQSCGQIGALPVGCGTIDPDSDHDGMLDDWEEQIVNADPDDDIQTIADVLPGDDFDGDGFSNLRESQGASDPTDIGNIPSPAFIHVAENAGENQDGSPTDPFDTIQAAIDLAGPGDTVLVADGTYTGTGNQDLDFYGKAITVQSENGPEHTTINCQGNASDPHRGIWFHSGEGPDSVFTGFSIVNGHEWNGGGINCSSSTSPTISNCTIADCTAQNVGGGIYVQGGSPLISRCMFKSNHADSKSGGGLYLQYAAATVTRCAFFGNTSTGYTGGGISVTGSATSKINSCSFSGNSAAKGGGIFIANAGGAYILNCSFSSNSATTYGGGLFIHDAGSASIVNSILWNNTCLNGPQIAVQDNTAAVNVSYSDVQGGLAEIDITGAPVVNWDNASNTGELPSHNPVFMDETGPDSTVGTADDDLRLSPGSPCIDSGKIGAFGLSGQDFEGDPRIWPANGVVDMGMDEVVLTKGLMATYSTGAQVLEGPIFHGYSADCTGTDFNLYQGECTPLTASPVNWAWENPLTAEWHGYIYPPVTGDYSFRSFYWVDGIIYIEINRTVIADLNTPGGGYNGNVTLQQGSWVPIRMSFDSNGGSNTMVLGWVVPGGSWEPVPETYMTPTAASLDTCAGDLDNDGNVDGLDLAILADDPGSMILTDFAAEFGLIGCME